MGRGGRQRNSKESLEQEDGLKTHILGFSSWVLLIAITEQLHDLERMLRKLLLQLSDLSWQRNETVGYIGREARLTAPCLCKLSLQPAGSFDDDDKIPKLSKVRYFALEG